MGAGRLAKMDSAIEDQAHLLPRSSSYTDRPADHGKAVHPQASGAHAGWLLVCDGLFDLPTRASVQKSVVCLSSHTGLTCCACLSCTFSDWHAQQVHCWPRAALQGALTVLFDKLRPHVHVRAGGSGNILYAGFKGAQGSTVALHASAATKSSMAWPQAMQPDDLPRNCKTPDLPYIELPCLLSH